MRLTLTLVTTLLFPVQLPAQDQVPTMARRSTVYAPRAAIATSQPLATAAGLRVLQQGGNAIDAAVAAAAVLNVTEPHMTGMGGDLFAIVWSARDGKLHGLHANGRSGSLMTREELVRRNRESVPSRGPEAVSVPGALSGWAALLERFGTHSLAQALEPAIRIAEEGFPVTPIIAEDWAQQVQVLQRDPGARATFLLEGQRSPRAGEWFRNPDLARSFRQIAAEGPGAFYGGALGQRVVDGLREMGGFLTLEDLASHRVSWVTPISVPFQGYRLYELPPPGQGIAALQKLGILSGFDLKAMGHNTPIYLHHLIEAKKLAYADLAAHVADPDHMRADVARLISPAYFDQRRVMIDPARAAERMEPGAAQTAGETIYLTVADAEGNMVSFINSVYGYFGSGVVIPGTGIMLQNRASGFTMAEGHPNTVAPRKQPYHTIIPAFVTRDTPTGEEPWMSFGVMGGGHQPQGHVQVLLNMLLFGMDPQQAVDAPRFNHPGGLRVQLEGAFGEEVRAGLRALGHEPVTGPRLSFGGAQVIVKLARGWAAASDPRKDGHAAGW
jgi:gamma-glutamyltranspeptidase/glutathione hydrolase